MTEISKSEVDQTPKGDVEKTTVEPRIISPESVIGFRERFLRRSREANKAREKYERENANKEYAQMETEQKALYSEQLGLIEDEKIKEILDAVIAKLAKTAGFSEGELELALINSPEINAFVYQKPGPENSPVQRDDSPGQFTVEHPESHIIFMYTGLINKFAEYKKKRANQNLEKKMTKIISATNSEFAEGGAAGLFVKIQNDQSIEEELSILTDEEQKIILSCVDEWREDGTVSEDNLAYVISHEICHLQQQRSDEPSMVTRKQQEYDADLTGISEIMSKAGFNPREALEMQEFLISLGSSNFSLTHPCGESRRQEVLKLISDPDTILQGMTARPKELTSKPEKPYRSEEIIKQAQEARTLDELIGLFAKNNENLSDLHDKMTVSLGATEYLCMRALAERPWMEEVFAAYLILLGGEIKKSINEFEAYLDRSEKELHELNEKSQSTELSIDEKSKILSLQREIPNIEDKLASMKAGDSSKMTSDVKYLYTYLYPETYSGVQAWNKSSLGSASGDILDEVLAELPDLEKVNTFQLSSYSAIKLDCSAGQPEARGLADQWLETGSVEAKYQEKIRLALACLSSVTKKEESKSDYAVGTEDSIHYDFGTPEGRKDYQRDFSTSILYENKYHKDNLAFGHVWEKHIEPITQSFCEKFSAMLPKDIPAETKETIAREMFESLYLAGQETQRPSAARQHLPEVVPLLPKCFFGYGGIDSNLDPYSSKLVASWPSEPKSKNTISLLLDDSFPSSRVPIRPVDRSVLLDTISTLKNRFPEEVWQIEKLLVLLDEQVIAKPETLVQDVKILQKKDAKLPEYYAYVKEVLKNNWSKEELSELCRQLDQTIQSPTENLVKLIVEIYQICEPVDLDGNIWSDLVLSSKEYIELLSHLTRDGIGGNRPDFKNDLKAFMDQSDPDALLNAELIQASVTSENKLDRNPFSLNQTMNSENDDILKLEKLTHKQPEELLSWLAEYRIYFSPHRLTPYYKNGKVSIEWLRNYLHVLDKAKDLENRQKTGDDTKDLPGKFNSIDSWSPAVDLGSSSIDILLLELEKDDPDFYNELSKTSKYDAANKIVEYFDNKQASLTEILDRFARSEVRDKLLISYANRQGVSYELFSELKPYFQDQVGDRSGGNKDDFFGNVLTDVIDSISESEKKEYIDRYWQMHRDGTIKDYEDFEIFHGSNSIIKLAEQVYSKAPDQIIDPQSEYEKSLDIVLNTGPSSVFRDYLLKKVFYLGILGKDFKEEFSSHSLPFLEASYGIKEYGEICQTEVSNFEPQMVNSVNFETLKKLVDQIYPNLHSVSAQRNLGRLLIERPELVGKPEKFDLILKYIPDPCSLRDYLIKNYLLESRLEIKDLESIEALLSSAATKGSKLSKNSEVEFVGTEILRGIAPNTDRAERSELLLWLFGASASPPERVQITGGMLGLNFDNQIKDFQLLSSNEKRDFLAEHFLGDKGLFEPSSEADNSAMKNFLGEIFDQKIAPNLESQSEFMKPEMLRDIFLTVFEAYLPERRHYFFAALIEKMGGEKSISGEDFIAIFFEQVGAAGIKLGQVLSNSPEINESLRNRLSELKSAAEPFNPLGVVSRMKDHGLLDGEKLKVTSLDAFLGAASIKQAHIVTAEVDGEPEQEVVKAKRITIDKYIDHDLQALAVVFDRLRKNWDIQIPRYLLSEISATLHDETDFVQEARKQELLGKSLPKKDKNGFSFQTTKVRYASEDTMMEKLAPGVELGKMSKSDPVKYEKYSRAVGQELFREIFETGIFHADLHDGNVFVDEENKAITFIDAGAVGEGAEYVANFRSFFEAIDRGGSKVITREILALSKDSVLLTSEKRDELKSKIELITQEYKQNKGKKNTTDDKNRSPLGEAINQISYTLLDYVEPTPALRYFMKALATGAPHLERVDLGMKQKSYFATARMKSIFNR